MVDHIVFMDLTFSTWMQEVMWMEIEMDERITCNMKF
jgi:hypothetical protein